MKLIIYIALGIILAYIIMLALPIVALMFVLA